MLRVKIVLGVLIISVFCIMSAGAVNNLVIAQSEGDSSSSSDGGDSSSSDGGDSSSSDGGAQQQQ